MIFSCEQENRKRELDTNSEQKVLGIIVTYLKILNYFTVMLLEVDDH